MRLKHPSGPQRLKRTTLRGSLWVCGFPSGKKRTKLDIQLLQHYRTYSCRPTGSHLMGNHRGYLQSLTKAHRDRKGAGLMASSTQFSVDHIPACPGTQTEIPISRYTHEQNWASELSDSAAWLGNPPYCPWGRVVNSVLPTVEPRLQSCPFGKHGCWTCGAYTVTHLGRE